MPDDPLTYLHFFRCRWCGAVFSVKAPFVLAVDLQRHHECGEGRNGIADAIGYRKLKDYEKGA